MGQLLGRLFYLIAGAGIGSIALLSIATNQIERIRVLHIEGVFNSFGFGCVLAFNGEQGSNARCKKMALKHQSDIREIVSE